MESRKNPSVKTEPRITEAAEKAGNLIRDLQSRLNAGSGDDAQASESVELQPRLDVGDEGVLVRELQSRLRAGDEKAGVVMRELQSRLKNPAPAAIEKLPDESSSERAPAKPGLTATGWNEIRRRVVEGVAEGILREWGSQAGAVPASLEDELVDRLIDQVIERLGTPRVTPQEGKR